MPAHNSSCAQCGVQLFPRGNRQQIELALAPGMVWRIERRHAGTHGWSVLRLQSDGTGLLVDECRTVKGAEACARWDAR